MSNQYQLDVDSMLLRYHDDNRYDIFKLNLKMSNQCLFVTINRDDIDLTSSNDVKTTLWRYRVDITKMNLCVLIYTKS